MTEQTTLAEIVKKHPAAATVFDQFDLDYCCRGNVSLREACPDEKKYKEVSGALDKALAVAGQQPPATENFTLPQLIDYIVQRHHAYVKGAMPAIFSHLHKVATKHGDRHPEMREVFRLFSDIQLEMETHMMKEEHVLFPMIRTLALQGTTDPAFRRKLEGPIRVMLHEHESAGAIMHEIRMRTNQYQAPPDACTTFRVSLEELKTFEADLHRHVHLENHLLFPKALALCNAAQESA